MLSEVSRVLKDKGIYICVSYGTPFGPENLDEPGSEPARMPYLDNVKIIQSGSSKLKGKI